MKKKVGEKILLCLMMCLSLFGSTLTAFATTVTGNDVSNGEPTVVGLDLSNFEDKSLKEVGGIFDSKLYLLNGYSYFVLYYDGTDYYNYVKPDDTEGTLNKVTVDTANSLISSSNNYNFYGRDGEYYCVGEVDTLDSNAVKSFYLFMYDDSTKKFSNIGLFDSVASMESISTLDLEEKLPELNVSVVNKTSASATINVKYTSSSNVYTIVCSSDTTDLFVKDTDEKSRLTGEFNFDITSNGEYTIEGYTSPYITKDVKHSEVKIKVDNISEVTPEENEAKNSDSKAPVVTFSSLPDSEVTGNSVEVTMYSDEPAILNFNGVSSDDYVTEMKVTVKYNGDYTYSANDESGNMTEDVLKVSFFKDSSTDDSDRDSFWGDAIDEALPQTGSTSFKVIVAIGIVLIGGGIFFIVKSKKKKGEVSSDSVEDEN